MSQVMRLTDGNFKQEVLQSSTPVLVEFSGSWCVASQQMRPLLKQMATEYKGRLKFGYLNVDQNPRVAAQYKIMGCPTFIGFSLDQPVARKAGAQSKKQLLQMLEGLI